MARQRPTPENVRAAEEAISLVSRQVKFTIAEYPISLYVERFKNDTDDRYFVPEYQRNLSWNPSQQSEFIESLIVGLPVPFLFFYQTMDGRMEIVDGSQRMRAMRAFLRENLVLHDLALVPELEGFTFADLPHERQNKLEDVTIRTIVLDTSTDPATRAEMFARINKGGTEANEAEIRRGSLPGPVTSLIRELAEHPNFVALTPFTPKAVLSREREELITRFFAYTETYDTRDRPFANYRDRPKKYLYEYLERANREANENPQLVDSLRQEFLRVLDFVDRSFSLGFRKSAAARTVPRVRFEAIAVGTALALREEPGLAPAPELVSERMAAAEFDKLVVSDGANVRSKLVGRIELVRDALLGR